MERSTIGLQLRLPPSFSHVRCKLSSRKRSRTALLSGVDSVWACRSGAVVSRDESPPPTRPGGPCSGVPLTCRRHGRETIVTTAGSKITGRPEAGAYGTRTKMPQAAARSRDGRLPGAKKTPRKRGESAWIRARTWPGRRGRSRSGSTDRHFGSTCRPW
jgi:hypothetical protein